MFVVTFERMRAFSPQVDGQNVVVVRSERQLVAGTVCKGGATGAQRSSPAMPEQFENFFRETTDLETAKGKQNIIGRARLANGLLFVGRRGRATGIQTRRSRAP
jgi:hypothetical protein